MDTITENNKLLRSVEISGHQEFWKGYFHCFATISSKTFALVEDLNGKVHKIDLEYSDIKFTDRSVSTKY